MQASGGSKPPEIMSTHPADATRIANLKQEMPEALTYYKPVK
jgi:predicted Zn-dependent protease